MGDPLAVETPKGKTAPKAAPVKVEAAPAVPPASEAQAISAEQSANFTRARRGARNQFVGPMGVRYDATPYVKARYDPRGARLGATPILGAPEEIVGDDFKRDHPGWHYLWPMTTSNQTQAYIRSSVYVRVPFDQIDSGNPLAAVAPSPEGYTTWMQHSLVAISPRWFAELYQGPEIESVQRASITREQVEAEIDAQFSRGGFKAEAEIFTDLRQEQIR